MHITKIEYQKALNICKDYLDQESKYIVSEQEKLKQNKRQIENLDNIESWLKLKKGDSIKIIERQQGSKSKLRKGEVLQIHRIDKQIFETEMRLRIFIQAKISDRIYSFKAILYSNNFFQSNCVFEKI